MKKRAKNKNILVGVCGGIASYKTCELVRLLIKNGHSVRVMMTPAAARFVTPLVFEHLSQQAVFVEMFGHVEERTARHISLARWADVCVVAPLSANTLAKIATGICDNLLTTVVCALPRDTTVVLAPAMNECMWKNPLVQEQVSKLRKLKKYSILHPHKGALACGSDGEGRMPDPRDIYADVMKTLRG